MAFEGTMAPPLANPIVPPPRNGSTRARLADIPTELTLAKLSVGQYHAMARKGILKSGDPVELLEGWLVRKMTKHPPHTTSTRLIVKAFEAIIPEGWFVDSQEPITLSDSEPEPDVMVIRGNPRDYGQHHPGPKEVVLVVEVADSTILRDRGTKKRVYARAGIPIYWVINLLEKQVEVYTRPKRSREPDYQTQQIYTISDKIPLIIEGRELGTLVVKDLLP